MRLKIGVSLVLLAAASAAETDWTAAGKAWWSHVEFLADDRLEGRNVGSKGFETAADYVTSQFEQAGLTPGAGASYSQPVEFTKVTLDEASSWLELLRNGTAMRITPGDEALLGAPPKTANTEAPLVFAGYGLNIPEAGFNDLKDSALNGAVAVILQGGPASISGNLRSHYSFADQRAKAMKAAGVVGVISIPNPKSMDIPWTRQSANRLMPRMSLADPAVSGQGGWQFTATWNPAKADELFEGSGHTIAEILDAADHDRPLPHFACETKVRAHVVTAQEKVQSRNIVGVRQGSDPALRSQYVVISAHLDHLGVGEPVNGDRIFNGAMDDASGIASLIEIARALKANIRTKRSIVFLAVTGEEKGLQGSHYFAERSTVPGAIVADINMDMFLPLFPLRYLEVQGLNESTLGDDIRAVAAGAKVEIQADKEPNANRFIRSDQYSFIRKGVPSLAFKFGWMPGSPEEKIYRDWYRTRYHAVTDDTGQPVDKEAAARFNAILTGLLERVADAPAAPKWKEDSFFRRFAN